MRSLFSSGIFLTLIISVIGNLNNSSEDTLNRVCNCNLRYLKHYETKGCQVVQVDSCGCPIQYTCSLASEGNEKQEVCIYQNEEYKPGSRINVTDRCLSCRCSRHEQQPHIVCRHKECPQLEPVQRENCHPVYERNHCCPSKYECVSRSNENDAIETDFICVHDGVSYPLGARIYPSEDPCLICECSENWQGVSNTSCHQQECLLEKHKKLLDAGCIPVYHENKCCPIEFYCPESHRIKTNLNPLEFDLPAENNELDGENNACLFRGEMFKIGTELSMTNPCIRCSCLVPPDLTCVHRSCPPAPNIEHCEVIVSSNYCCPSYECLYEDSPRNSSEVKCPTPVCEDATCEIKIPEGHQCPTCVCDDRKEHEINAFESEENSMEEGSMKNASLSESNHFEKESLENETLIPIEIEASSKNDNKSEKFVNSISEEEVFENEDAEKLEHEMGNNFKKGNETTGSKGESSREELDLSMEKFQVSDKNSEEPRLLKMIRRRSTDYQNRVIAQQQNQMHQNQFPQQQFFDEYETDSDRETLEGDDEGFDELKLSKKNSESRERKLESEEIFGSASIIVPAGCPTPLCANSSCKIEIPFGHHCPTCVCKSRENWQP